MLPNMLEDQRLSNLASVATPLPPLADDKVFTDQQWQTLLSICEVFMPNLTKSGIKNASLREQQRHLQALLPEGSPAELISAFLAESVADDVVFKESIRLRFLTYIPRAQSKGLAFLLSALDTRVGCLAMTGSTTSLHNQALPSRSRIVFGWAQSYLTPLRALYQAGEFLTKATWLTQAKILHNVLDYPEVPKHIIRRPGFEFAFLDFTNHPKNEVVELKADIVIIGSGCGAGVVAEHLSTTLESLQPRPRIIVIEKGYHFPSSHFPMSISSASAHLFESGGGVLSDDGSIAVVAGSTWGGGGTVNWSASLQPSYIVREEWATKYNLPFFQTSEYQTCLDEVCHKMGACSIHDHEALSKIEQNFANETLLEGARKLGLMAEVVPQNTAGRTHNCGRCSMGCASATKQGPANYWLPRAAEHGVDFIEGCFVERITWDEASPSLRRATGLKATWTSSSRAETRSLNILCPRIIVSAGTLHSPLLLHRSGLTPEYNRNIGANLHLHPTLITSATFPNRVNPWDGSILTSAVTSADNLDGQGHGPKLEIMIGTPDLTCMVSPFRPQLTIDAMAQLPRNPTPEEIEMTSQKTALDYRTRLAHHGYSFGIIVIQRDHAQPSTAMKSYVYADADNPRMVKINYTAGQKDREHLLEGTIIASKIVFAQGATVIDIFTPHILPWYRPSVYQSSAEFKSHDADADTVKARAQAKDEQSFAAWLADIKSKGAHKLLDPRTTRLGSAHQMSTSRMSASRNDGVVDPYGRVWGTEGVWVADASVLPTASGVNPMVSTMAVSLHIARGIAKEVQHSWTSSH